MQIEETPAAQKLFKYDTRNPLFSDEPGPPVPGSSSSVARGCRRLTLRLQMAYSGARRTPGEGTFRQMPENAFPDALPAESRLHWYVLERVLGQGGFGITYLARDTNLDQTVAIKEYLPVEVATRMADGTIRSRTEDLRDRYRWGLERFIQEARTLARFDHPNIVRVLSVFEFNGTAYMVMRFEKGGTLAALLDHRGTLPEAELLQFVTPILNG